MRTQDERHTGDENMGKLRSTAWWKRLKPQENQSVPEVPEESISPVAHPAGELPGEDLPVPEVPEEEPLEDTLMGELARELGLLGLNEPLRPSFFTLDGEVPTEELLDFLEEIEKTIQREREDRRLAAEARERIAAAAKADRALAVAEAKAAREAESGESGEAVEVDLPEAAEEKEEPEDAEPEIPPADMRLFTKISQDGLTAWAFLLPPVGGQTPDEAALDVALRERGICFGTDLPALLDAIDQRRWMKLLVIARGQLPRDGVDGQIVDRFSRDKQIRLQEDEARFMNYKNLNWLQTVSAGAVICDVIPPVPEENGQTVNGKVLPAKEAKTPPVPAGTNTWMNEDKTALVAACDGQISFTNGMFHVQQTLHINGDVDNSVGNLSVMGNIIIDGNVADGFTVSTTGSIQVRGLVEGAFLSAGTDIQVSLGMKGNSRGVMEAKGAIKCQYLENCTVKAGGSVTAETIINSFVSSSDSIKVLSGRGAIMGGKITALKTVEAKIVGNESNRVTLLCAGADVQAAEEMEQLKRELSALKVATDEMEKSIAYLEGMEGLDQYHLERLAQVKLKNTVDKMTLAKKMKALQAKEAAHQNSKGQITVGIAYPGTNISIDNLKLIVHSTERACRFYVENGEIVIGHT